MKSSVQKLHTIFYVIDPDIAQLHDNFWSFTLEVNIY